MRALPVFYIALLFYLAPASSWSQELHCSPCAYSFGQVAVDSSSTYSIKLLNSGSKTLEITSKSEQGSGFSTGNIVLPLKISPGASLELPITFAPAAKGYAAAAFTLVSNDPSSPHIIKVHGTGVAGSTSSSPQLEISPSTLAFGSVTVGSSSTLQATLTASNAAVTISSDQSTSSEFSISGLTLPATIAAGKSLAVSVKFTPNASGTASAKAGFVSNAKNTPTVAQVTGTGVAQSAHNVDLTWDAAADSPVGYNVYRGTAESGPYSQINTALNSSTTYTDSTVIAGQTYYYVVAAVNSKGQESPYSNVAEAAVP